MNLPGFRLPTGGALDWDMTTLTDGQLEHEYHLAYEVLNDIYCSYSPWNGGVAIKGMLKEDDPKTLNDPNWKSALETWRLRLSNAETEIERRFLLS
jgi:hypothetical protein